jgi:Leu/Phe-tRNA-protein transferase
MSVRNADYQLLYYQVAAHSVRQWRTQELFGGGGVTPGNFFGELSTNSVEDRGQRKWGSGDGSP